MKNINPETLQKISLIDWISILLKYSKGKIVSREFRLKKRGERIELATRNGNFLPGWQGYIIPKKDPVIHLTRVDGHSVSLDVPLPSPDSSRDTFVTKETPVGKIMVLFTKSLTEF